MSNEEERPGKLVKMALIAMVCILLSGYCRYCSQTCARHPKNRYLSEGKSGLR